MQSNGTTSRCTPSFLDAKAKQLLINGKWVEAASGKTFPSYNPSTGRALVPCAFGDEEDINRAVAAARRAFEGPWSKFKPRERQAVLLKLAQLIEANFDELCMLDTLDMGMPVSFTPYMKPMLLGTYEYCAGQALSLEGETIPNSTMGDIFSFTVRDPVGVVGGIIPWNGPAFNATWKIAPVLATGCTLVLKAAEQACYSPLRLGELCLEAGVPPGVINVISGYGDAGAALVAHKGVDKIAFTGSSETGQRIAEASARTLKRLTMELGGKSANIVFADADQSKAVAGAAMAVFANSGQICCAGTRLFVERRIFDEFTHRVAEFGQSLRVGNSLDPATQMGPLVSEEQLNRVTGYLALGKEEGASVLCGGSRLQGELADGYFVAPTVFADVKDSMRIAREEIFGPVICAIPFDDPEEVVQRANSTDFGLASGIWTTDVGKAHKMARRMQSGSVWVNCYNAMDPAVPFGGRKLSGYGSEGGRHQLQAYLNMKAVWVNTD